MWVNLLVLIPLTLYFAWRNRGIQIPGRQLLFVTIFALAFGFVEAAAAVYLSAAAGLLPGYMGTLSEVQRLAEAAQPETLSIEQFPPQPVDRRGAARGRHNSDVGQCCSAGRYEGARAVCRFPLDVRFVGPQLLCRALGHDPLAYLSQRSRPAVSHPRTLGCASMVPVAGKCSHSARCGFEQKTHTDRR